MQIELVEVTKDNWRDVAAVEPLPDQARFVAPVTRYLCLGLFDGEWHSLGVVDGERTVGHVMWAFDPDEDAHWIGGVVIDAAEQGRGVGRATVLALIEWLRRREDARHFALSYLPDNTTARHLYRSLGFVETGEMADDEIVARMNQAG